MKLHTALLALGLSALIPAGAETILIVGGTVIDGTGAPGRVADILIEDGVIARVAQDIEAQADHVIDAGGMVVTPGFIDTHAHGDPLDNVMQNFLAMGATTICLGQDGSHPGGANLAGWIASVEAAEIDPNVAVFVGHATVRRATGAGYDQDLTAEQLAAMSAMVEEGLEAGAFGLTTGLEYSGGRPANAEELVAIARPVGERGGVVMSHLRSEDDDVIEDAINELLDQCRATGAGAHISHMKIVYGHGAERAEEILALLDAARAEGMQVTADIYPYTASYTGIGIVFPDWALPPNDFEEVVAASREALHNYLTERIALRNGPEATLFGSGRWSGMTLAEVAASMEKPFEDVLIDDIQPGGASAAYFVMDEEVMERFLQDPHVMVCSDGSPTGSHPRGHGTFAKIIDDYVLEQPLIPLEEAIRKMTSLSADTIGLADRGRLAEGMVADVLVFDPEEVTDTATFEESIQLAEGIDWVIVNGELVRADGEFTGTRAGQMLRRRW